MDNTITIPQQRYEDLIAKEAYFDILAAAYNSKTTFALNNVAEVMFGEQNKGDETNA